MEEAKTITDKTPLIVNFLRLIRNGRLVQCEAAASDGDRFFSFYFGGLSMTDSGPFKEAEDVWCAIVKKNMDASRLLQKRCSTFLGPLYLMVMYSDLVVEQWTVQDYRDARCENSIPCSYEQLEELNALVRIVYTYLRVFDVRRSVTHQEMRADDIIITPHQVCVSTGEANKNPVGGSDGPQRDKLFHIHVYGSTEEFTKLEEGCAHSQQWYVADLIRIEVSTNALLRTQLLHSRPKQSISALSTPALNSASEGCLLHNRDVATHEERAKTAWDSEANAGTSPRMRTSPTGLECESFFSSVATKSCNTPSLVPAAVPAPMGLLLAPSLPFASLPAPTSMLSLPLVSNADAPLASDNTFLKLLHLPGEGSPLPTASFSLLQKTSAATAGARSDVVSTPKDGETRPPSYVLRMGSSLFCTKGIKLHHTPRAVGAVFDTMAAIPFCPDEDVDELADSARDISCDDASDGGSPFCALEFVQRARSSQLAAQRGVLKNLLLSLDLD